MASKESFVVAAWQEGRQTVDGANCGLALGRELQLVVGGYNLLHHFHFLKPEPAPLPVRIFQQGKLPQLDLNRCVPHQVIEARHTPLHPLNIPR